jgi:hypothetical protein
MKRMDVNIRAVDLQLLILSCIKVQIQEKKLKTRKPICRFKCIQVRPEFRSTEMWSNIFNIESNIQISTNIHDGPIF